MNTLSAGARHKLWVEPDSIYARDTKLERSEACFLIQATALNLSSTISIPTAQDHAAPSDVF